MFTISLDVAKCLGNDLTKNLPDGSKLQIWESGWYSTLWPKIFSHGLRCSKSWCLASPTSFANRVPILKKLCLLWTISSPSWRQHLYPSTPMSTSTFEPDASRLPSYWSTNLFLHANAEVCVFFWHYCQHPHLPLRLIPLSKFYYLLLLIIF